MELGIDKTKRLTQPGFLKKFWGSRFGAKSGQKRALFEFSRKVFIRFCSCLVRKGLLWFLICVQSLESRKILVLEILGKKWSKRGQKGLFLNFLENSSFVFLDIVHVDRGQ